LGDLERKKGRARGKKKVPISKVRGYWSTEESGRRRGKDQRSLKEEGISKNREERVERGAASRRAKKVEKFIGRRGERRKNFQTHSNEGLSTWKRTLVKKREGAGKVSSKRDRRRNAKKTIGGRTRARKIISEGKAARAASRIATLHWTKIVRRG